MFDKRKNIKEENFHLQPQTPYAMFIANGMNGVTFVIDIISGKTLFDSKKEGFSLMGAPLNYKIGEGVPWDTWTNTHSPDKNAEKDMYAPLSNNVSDPVPLSDDQLFLFSGNKFSPECCYKPNQYSTGSGCACISVEQMKYLNSRGGNNNLPN